MWSTAVFIVRCGGVAVARHTPLTRAPFPLPAHLSRSRSKRLAWCVVLLQVVKEDLKEEEAEELKGKLEAAGATVELE